MASNTELPIIDVGPLVGCSKDTSGSCTFRFAEVADYLTKKNTSLGKYTTHVPRLDFFTFPTTGYLKSYKRNLSSLPGPSSQNLWT